MTARFPKWWLLYSAAKIIFLRFGVITLLILAPLFTLSLASGEYVTTDDYAFAAGCWFILISPFLINYFIAKTRKQKILSVLDEIKSTGYFNPSKNTENWFFWQNTYLGFDYHQGTIVYIRIYPGNIMDIIGFDAYSLTRTEVEGPRLRLYTRLESMPMIPIDTHAAPGLAEQIHSMNNKGYSYHFNFPDIVKKKRQQLETLAGMPVPELI